MLHLASRKNSSSNRFDLCFFHGRTLSSAIVVLSKQIVNRKKLPQVRRILTSGLTDGHPGAYTVRYLFVICGYFIAETENFECDFLGSP
jgi:hypothetical protein